MLLAKIIINCDLPLPAYVYFPSICQNSWNQKDELRNEDHVESELRSALHRNSSGALPICGIKSTFLRTMSNPIPLWPQSTFQPPSLFRPPILLSSSVPPSSVTLSHTHAHTAGSHKPEFHIPVFPKGLHMLFLLPGEP